MELEGFSEISINENIQQEQWNHSYPITEAHFEENCIRLVARDNVLYDFQLVVTSKKKITMPQFFSERRHAREINLLRDENCSLFIHHPRDIETVAAAVENAVEAFFDNGWLTGAEYQDVKNAVLFSENEVHNYVTSEDPNLNMTLPVTVVFGEVPNIEKRLVALISLQGTEFVALVLAPTTAKPTKSAQELALSVASFLSFSDVRHKLSIAKTREEVNEVLDAFFSVPVIVRSQERILHDVKVEKRPCCGIWNDLRRRLPFYVSDYRDGFVGPKHLQKMISTAFFLFFIILLPSLALGEAFSVGTNGIIAIQQVLWIQLLAGCSFAVLGGQPLVVIMTTAPFALFTRVLYGISLSLSVPFLALYGWTGIFCAGYGVIAAVFNLSYLIRYFTLFTEETFAIFIAISFVYSSILACVSYFELVYTDDAASALLYLFLLLFSTWLALTINSLRKTPLLNVFLREMVSDFALPIGVLFSSFLGSYVFQLVTLPRFGYSPSGRVFEMSDLLSLPLGIIFACAGFGLILAALFLIDHSISSAMAQTPSMKLRKGSAYHWDLLLTSCICLISSLFGLPWVNASVPHSPLHTIALADIEEINTDGALRNSISYAREIRVSILLANAMIGLCLLTLPLPLQYIPVPVLYGVFLFMAFSSLDGNTFWDRIKLLITQQNRYPAYPFIRRVSKKKIHWFTVIQLIFLVVLCVVSFVPQDFVNLMFPLLLIVLLLIRQFFLPCFFSSKDVAEIDSSYTIN